MVPLLTVVVIGVILALTHGHYQADLVIVLFSALCACFISFLGKHGNLNAANSVKLSAGTTLYAAALFSVLIAFDNELIYASQLQYKLTIKIIIAISAAFVISSVGYSCLKQYADYKLITPSHLLLAAIVLLVAARVLVPFASPEPHIDVYWINSWATRDLLRGLNPYAQSYHDIYNGAYGYAPGFTYWPGYLLAVAPFTFAGLDIRFLSVAADVVVAWVLWSLTSAISDSKTRYALIVTWLAMPTSLFIVEQAWVDNYLLAIIALAFYAFQTDRLIVSGCLFGLAAASKQYGFIPLIPLTVLLLSLGSAKRLGVLIGSALLTSGLIFLPFVIWDFGAIVKNTVLLLFAIPPRSDSLSVVALLANQYAIHVPGVVLVAVYIATLVAAGFFTIKSARSVGSLMAITAFIYACLFIFGKQAFCNYYVMLCGVIMLALTQKAPDAADRS
jgi:uncharacterized membrane protein